MGAGVAGLTLAERLLAAGSGEVVLLEREVAAGGLARTFCYDGFRFDIGPHRFHTDDGRVRAYVCDLMGGDVLTIPRASSVYLGGAYHDWPLNLAGMFRLPLGMLAACSTDFLRRRVRGAPRSFEEHILAKYGPHLYAFFFRDYTRKFTGLDGTELHPDWAAAGVNRAVIDKRVKADSLFSLAGSILLPKPVSTLFLYPSNGGMQGFVSKLESAISGAGGVVRTSTPAAGPVLDGGAVKGVSLEDGEVIECDEAVWTAPATGILPSGLRFIHTVVFNVALRARRDLPYQWCYFGDPGICFSRLSVPRNFDPAMVPGGADSITAEITCSGSEDFWSDPGLLLPDLIRDLDRVGAAREEDILFVMPERVRETYPVYTLDYRERLEGVSPPAGLRLIGRCGSFWYNNMDHSIAQALAAAEGGSVSRDFWNPARP